jgi:glycosyltransferase involved in cell wall biosynthesis
MSAPIFGACFRALLSRPRSFVLLFVAVLQAWRKTPAEGSPPSDAPSPTTLSRGERLLAIYHHNPHVYLAKSLLLVPYAVYLTERLRAEGITHLHAHWATYPTTVAYLVKRWAGIPFSFTAHAYDIYMISRMLPAKLREASFVVTCADVNRRYLASLCDEATRSKLYVNYHGADLGRFVPVRPQRGDRFRIASCGWLKEYKGFHILIEALALLVRRGVDATLDLAGDGPQRRYLEEQSRNLGLADRVAFHGFVAHDRLLELYRKCDAFALPSVVMGRYGRQDVIPNVLAEAMAVGLPVVGSAIGGVAELIDHERDGLIVKERDPSDLADALERIWKDPAEAERLGAAGRCKVERIWDRTANLQQLADLFERYAHLVPERHQAVPTGVTVPEAVRDCATA